MAGTIYRYVHKLFIRLSRLIDKLVFTIQIVTTKYIEEKQSQLNKVNSELPKQIVTLCPMRI